MDKVKTSERTAEEEKFLEELGCNPKNIEYRHRSPFVATQQEDPMYLHRCPPQIDGFLTRVKVTAEDFRKEYDPVNHPAHYNNSDATCECGRRIECIDVTRHYAFNIGNAIKYLWRCDLKGNSIEDLKKAIWYINDEIQKREKSS